MSYWRWLLFAAMARLELREDRYLRLPKATTTMRNVSVLRGGRIGTAPGGNRRA